jgi:ATP-dependent protease Clp ATPase subunit
MIAKKAYTAKTGARSLDSIMNMILNPIKADIIGIKKVLRDNGDKSELPGLTITAEMVDAFIPSNDDHAHQAWKDMFL